jgi:hypothetical protein
VDILVHGGEICMWGTASVEVMRMIDLKYKEMKRNGRIPEIPRAPHGDYDPRLLNSPLQKLVASLDLKSSKQ